MHYAIRFTGSKAQKERAALAETRQYLGRKAFDSLLTFIRTLEGSRTQRYRAARFGCEMMGCRGYFVVRAMLRRASIIDQVVPRTVTAVEVRSEA